MVYRRYDCSLDLFKSMVSDFVIGLNVLYNWSCKGGEKMGTILEMVTKVL